MDVYNPEPEDLLRKLHGEDVLQGVLLGMVPGNSPKEQFAIVQLKDVKDLDSPVIVRVTPDVENNTIVEACE